MACNKWKMKFDDKYPRAQYLEQKDDVLKGDSFKVCTVCGAPTSWMEMNFQAYVCSEECCEDLWQDYVAAYNYATKKYGPPYPPYHEFDLVERFEKVMEDEKKNKNSKRESEAD